MALLKIEHMKKSFDGQEILHGIDLEVNKGDVIAVIGPSGSGKTTMLRCMNFLERAEEGRLYLDDECYDLHSIRHKEIAKIRKRTGFVFQNYNLFLNKTALENVTQGLIIGRKMPKEEAVAIAEAALQKVGLADKMDARPSQLSGGQQQRVAIARAIATNPEVIFFDEPTSALDPELIGEVLDVMRQMAEDGMTMIVVTHEMGFARNVSNRVVFMENGNIVTEDESKAFFNAPKDPRIQSFLSNIERNDA